MGAELPHHQVLARDHRAERQPTRDPFARQHDVGRHALLLDRPHRAAAPDAGLHLVADQQDPVPVAEVAQVAEPAFGGQHVPAFAEPRLDDDRPDLRGRNHPLEQDLLDVVEVPIEGVVDARQHRAEVRPILGLRGRERD